MEAKLSSLPMAERNMLARVMNDIDEDQVRHLHSTNLDSACSLKPISSYSCSLKVGSALRRSFFPLSVKKPLRLGKLWAG